MSQEAMGRKIALAAWLAAYKRDINNSFLGNVKGKVNRDSV